MEFVKVFLNASWHEYIYTFLLIIPINGECIIQLSFPIYCDFVQFLECFDEILYMLLSKILDTKVINDEVEGGGSELLGQ